MRMILLSWIGNCYVQLHNGIFISDVCSSIPLDLIIRWARVDNHMSAGGAVSGTKNSLKMLRLLCMAKLFRLLLHK